MKRYNMEETGGNHCELVRYPDGELVLFDEALAEIERLKEQIKAEYVERCRMQSVINLLEEEKSELKDKDRNLEAEIKQLKEAVDILRKNTFIAWAKQQRANKDLEKGEK